MNESGTRKPFRIVSDELPENLPKWRVRTGDGQLRGPLSDNGLKALSEVGILNAGALITEENSENWISISQHPVWAELNLSKKRAPGAKLVLTGSTPPMPAPVTHSAAESVPPMVGVADRRERAAAIEHEKTVRTFRLLGVAKAVRFVREILVLALFIATADLLGLFVDGAFGAARWLLALGLVVAALLYYLFQLLA